MKKLRITVDGTVYDVLVEVLEDDEQYLATGGIGAPLTASPPPAASVPAPQPGAASPPAPGRAASDPDTIASPIAGTVQKVFVTAGTNVEAKTPVVLLDAMKMDTYIYAPRTGAVAEVAVAAGDAVQVGDVLIRYQAGG